MFLQELGVRLGRNLLPRKPGRPRKSAGSAEVADARLFLENSA